MKVRHKKTGGLGSSSRFNVHSLNEIIVGFDDGDMDSDYVSEYDVLLSSGEWKSLDDAFRDKDVLPDNYNTWFSEATDEADKARGYFL